MFRRFPIGKMRFTTTLKQARSAHWWPLA